MNDELRQLAERLLSGASDDIPERDRRVLARIAKRLHISRDVHRDYEEQRSLGDRLADRVAELGGSWGFIILFAAFLLVWAMVNTYVLASGAFDPYPYVFLNLILSMLAAIQAPIIMMSQNRQAAKDRLAAAHDYEVNLKAEIEIMGLHEKLDRLRTQQLTELVSSQQEQLRLLAALLERSAQR
jgi:uncharacterized membrane protein